MINDSTKVFLCVFNRNLPVRPSFEVIVLEDLSCFGISDRNFTYCCRFVNVCYLQKSYLQILRCHLRIFHTCGEVSNTVMVFQSVDLLRKPFSLKVAYFMTQRDNHTNTLKQNQSPEILNSIIQRALCRNYCTTFVSFLVWRLDPTRIYIVLFVLFFAQPY